MVNENKELSREERSLEKNLADKYNVAEELVLMKRVGSLESIAGESVKAEEQGDSVDNE